jgi:hypothetical protein
MDRIYMKKRPPTSTRFSSGLAASLLLLGVLAVLFWRSFLPDFVHFSNDGPLGQQNVDWMKLPAAFSGMWDDLNDIGFSPGAYAPSVIALIKWFLGPVGYSKFLAPIALFIVGLGAWTFFRQLKFSPLATILGALAAALNSAFFSDACWGTASHQIAIGMDFFALALIVSNSGETPAVIRWIRLALAGVAVGVNVMEGADIGALCSIFVAGFAFFKSVVETDGTFFIRAARGVGRVAVVAIFAGFIAVQTITSLVSSQIEGIAGAGQDSATKSANWDKATQWSLPKIETLGFFVPGLFGYKMDTPKDMMPMLQDAYRSGVYWGGIGREPAIDRFFDSGATGTPPPGGMRFSGGGDYCGVLVGLIAAWAIAQSFRRKDSPFTATQKKFIWFWSVILAASLLLAWGRFAPAFYGILYHLPYFSTIRNPVKFIIFFVCALLVLFAYGVQALSIRYLDGSAKKSAGLNAQLRIWWSKTGNFDHKWTFALSGIFGMGVLGWLIFAAQKPAFMEYLQKVGIPDAETAARMGIASSDQVAAFSLGQVGWFIILLAIAIALITLIIAGYFTGPRARLGSVLLGVFLVFDLGRADLPFIIHWDYKQKYEIGTLNPIEEILRDKPYEHRVAILPFDAQSQLREKDNWFGGSGLYRIEWAQHHFPYYNIQSLDIIQMPRVPEDIMAYWQTFPFPPQSAVEYQLMARHWQLTNTRYLLGAAGFLNVLNAQLDPGQNRFRIAQRFDVIVKPGVMQPTGLEQLTATQSPDGDLALFEFTGALPRAKLYSNWQVNTNNQANLKMLADLNFDPAKTVLISTPEKDLPAISTNENSGTVEFKSYAPMDIVFDANVIAPSVLLLNDKYDPQWSVTVDGKPAELLRCNFLMRGVYLTSGAHTVEFRFSLPTRPLHITLTAIGAGILLCIVLAVLTRRKPAN